MFERYDENARRALFFARYEASQLGSRSIEPEHLLLGLLRLDRNAASPFLARLPDIRTLLEGSVRTKEKIPVSVEIPFTKPTKRALQVAAQESERLEHRHIGPEHLLLALLADPTTVAGELLARNGLQLDAVRQQLATPATVDRPGPVSPNARGGEGVSLSTGGSSPAEIKRQAALRQIDATVTFVRRFGEEHAQTDEARRLIEQICRDFQSLKSHLPESN